MSTNIYKCTKCGAIHNIPVEDLQEDEPCMFCGGSMERKD